MAKTRPAPPKFDAKLKQAIREGLARGGIEADISLERIPGTKLRRVLVVSKQFDKMRPSERQDLVWRIVGQRFSQEDQLLISMIVTLAPSELTPDERFDQAMDEFEKRTGIKVPP